MENIAAKSHLDALGDRLINKLDALETRLNKAIADLGSKMENIAAKSDLDALGDRLIKRLDEWRTTMIKCMIVQGVVIVSVITSVLLALV